uniref:NR LBD domain-containing protein n=1 Tax=Panagrellus redivivus TaxID=6233 RepID=A0A7E4W1P1_PANRE
MIDMSEAAIRDMYATEPVFGRHLDTLVNASLPMWYRTEELIRQIRGLGMTNEEQSIFLLLGMIEIITLLSSKPLITRLRVKPLRDTVFQSMRAYYLENFSSDCTGVRFGQLIMVLPLMNEIYNLFAEHRTLINLCNGITENYTPASLLKAFHSQQVHTNCFYR